MRSVEKLQAAEFHERDVSTGQFDFQWSTVRGRAEENRLVLEEGAFLTAFEDLLNDVPRLVRLVAHSDQTRFDR